MSADRRRWAGFGVLCLGTFMIVLDTTIVNVALPSIKADLGFTDAALAWIVNAYMLTFGGFLLLSGRLGDLYGPRRLFVGGIVAFTLASVGCGLAPTQGSLVAMRALQGLAGAVVSAVGLALMMALFPDPAGRAKAMGFFGFVAAGGGSLGAVAGGFLTSVLDWRWVFLVNVPIGVAVLVAAFAYLPGGGAMEKRPRLDLAGALTVTLALLVAVYGIVGANEHGWTSLRTLGLLGLAVALLVGFLVIETRVREPLMPLGLFRSRNLSTSNVIGVLWAAAMFAWFFLSALYMQLVLGYTPMQVGLGFLAANVVMAIFSLGLSARIVMRFGTRAPLAAGLGLAAVGLALFARAPVDGRYVLDVLPGMLLLGFGAGMAMNPLLLSAMGDVKPSDAGLASGVVNTSFMMGGALGLAVLASLASARTTGALAAGSGGSEALNAGYHAAFLLGAVFAGVSAVLAGTLLRPAPVHPDAHVDAHVM